MSRASCISHPGGERLVIIRKWQLDACGKDACAAALLNLFEYWHNIKLEQNSQALDYNDVAQRHGEHRTQLETLLQWHTSEQLDESLLHIYSKRRIQAGIELLISLKFISVHRNPNPRYSFDKTRHFLFHPELVNDWLKQHSSTPDQDLPAENEESENDLSMVQNDMIDDDNLHLSSHANCTNGDVKNDLPLVQFAPTVGTNFTKQYTKITYQDYLQELPQKTHITPSCVIVRNAYSTFEIFWNKWVALTNKPINKKNSTAIFATLVRSEEDPLLSRILEALENQLKEKQLRQRLNLFTPQWPNPARWLLEARWEDEVFLDEGFYQAEIVRQFSGSTNNKQAIKQQREHYLDVQYKSRVNAGQDEQSNANTSRQAAIRQFDEEFRNRKRRM